MDPRHKAIRRAGYGVSFGPEHGWTRALPLWGTQQTAARAELRAALWALEWAREPLEIATDNEAVAKGIYQILFLDITPTETHEDLW